MGAQIGTAGIIGDIPNYTTAGRWLEDWDFGAAYYRFDEDEEAGVDGVDTTLFGFRGTRLWLRYNQCAADKSSLIAAWKSDTEDWGGQIQDVTVEGVTFKRCKLESQACRMIGPKPARDGNSWMQCVVVFTSLSLDD